eukprot:CAMPEP_0202728088 /NCGR_PEP_ID=MMETSP1385-20130828/185449_1 /ASSEMBLY_ACC=CAM_ASM_000861 /TAXON_ID=933848 /ORGANISM="Elphidium margaritaceum" /LENGTH=1158 /DNA_ID=CAMNT_0049394335 /DNA_START=155 /DNA_END=3632 /DNA_ORIENTATION=-
MSESAVTAIVSSKDGTDKLSPEATTANIEELINGCNLDEPWLCSDYVYYESHTCTLNNVCIFNEFAFTNSGEFRNKMTRHCQSKAFECAYYDEVKQCRSRYCSTHTLCDLKQDGYEICLVKALLCYDDKCEPDLSRAPADYRLYDLCCQIHDIDTHNHQYHHWLLLAFAIGAMVVSFVLYEIYAVLTRSAVRNAVKRHKYHAKQCMKHYISGMRGNVEYCYNELCKKGKRLKRAMKQQYKSNTMVGCLMHLWHDSTLASPLFTHWSSKSSSAATTPASLCIDEDMRPQSHTHTLLSPHSITTDVERGAMFADSTDDDDGGEHDGVDDDVSSHGTAMLSPAHSATSSAGSRRNSSRKTKLKRKQKLAQSLKRKNTRNKSNKSSNIPARKGNKVQKLKTLETSTTLKVPTHSATSSASNRRNSSRKTKLKRKQKLAQSLKRKNTRNKSNKSSKHSGQKGKQTPKAKNIKNKHNAQSADDKQQQKERQGEQPRNDKDSEETSNGTQPHQQIDEEEQHTPKHEAQEDKDDGEDEENVNEEHKHDDDGEEDETFSETEHDSEGEHDSEDDVDDDEEGEEDETFSETEHDSEGEHDSEDDVDDDEDEDDEKDDTITAHSASCCQLRKPNRIVLESTQPRPRPSKPPLSYSKSKSSTKMTPIATATVHPSNVDVDVSGNKNQKNKNKKHRKSRKKNTVTSNTNTITNSNPSLAYWTCTKCAYSNQQKFTKCQMCNGNMIKLEGKPSNNNNNNKCQMCNGNMIKLEGKPSPSNNNNNNHHTHHHNKKGKKRKTESAEFQYKQKRRHHHHHHHQQQQPSQLQSQLQPTRTYITLKSSSQPHLHLISSSNALCHSQSMSHLSPPNSAGSGLNPHAKEFVFVDTAAQTPTTPIPSTTTTANNCNLHLPNLASVSHSFSSPHSPLRRLSKIPRLQKSVNPEPVFARRHHQHQHHHHARQHSYHNNPSNEQKPISMSTCTQTDHDHNHNHNPNIPPRFQSPSFQNLLFSSTSTPSEGKPLSSNASNAGSSTSDTLVASNNNTNTNNTTNTNPMHTHLSLINSLSALSSLSSLPPLSSLLPSAIGAPLPPLASTIDLTSLNIAGLPPPPIAALSSASDLQRQLSDIEKSVQGQLQVLDTLFPEIKPSLRDHDNTTTTAAAAEAHPVAVDQHS